MKNLVRICVLVGICGVGMAGDECSTSSERKSTPLIMENNFNLFYFSSAETSENSENKENGGNNNSRKLNKSFSKLHGLKKASKTKKDFYNIVYKDFRRHLSTLPELKCLFNSSKRKDLERSNYYHFQKELLDFLDKKVNDIWGKEDFLEEKSAQSEDK